MKDQWLNQGRDNERPQMRRRDFVWLVAMFVGPLLPMLGVWAWRTWL
jgi:hypothetical protein